MPRFRLLLIFAVLTSSLFLGCTDSGSGNDGGSSTPTPTATPDDSEEISSQVIDDFLWKPQSERNGNLVVLVNPSNVRIDVTGVISETLTDSGPSNGRGTTGRSIFSGFQFGDNVRVEFFDSNNRRIRVANGDDFVTIPQGRDRFEFKL